MRLDTAEKRAAYRKVMIPAGAVLDPRSNGVGEVYTYTRANGKPAAIAFWGSSGRPTWHYHYRLPEHREAKIAEFFKSAASQAERMSARKAQREGFRHTLKVGDLLYTSWGYDQTNITFFEVTRVVSDKSVAVRQIAQDVVEEGFMQGRTVPHPGKYCWEEHVRQVREGNRVVNCEYSYSGSPCDSSPKWCSWYA